MTLPKHMKAIDIREPGGPEVLVPIECPIPALGDYDVLIKNSAVGVNRPDVAQRTVIIQSHLMRALSELWKWLVK